jgi:ATP-dependent RNA helicase RhlE
LPRQRQTLLFSATMPRPIALLAEDYLTDPVKVVVAPSATTVESVEQGVVFVPSDRKRDLLATLLRNPVLARVLVFTRTKHGADRVVRHLVGAGIEATAIHGNKSQPQRERALAGFRAGRTRVLVATDIAARGIDVDGVSHVINYELPNVPEDYVHRVGRTARAGAAGTAIAFCSDDERPYLRDIEKLTRCSLRAIPSAIPAPRGPIEAPAKAKPVREASLASRQAPANGRAAPAQHPPRAAGSDDRRGDPPATGSFPAFLRRPSSNKPGSGRPSSPGRRGEHRSRTSTRGSRTIGSRIGSD